MTGSYVACNSFEVLEGVGRVGDGKQPRCIEWITDRTRPKQFCLVRSIRPVSISTRRTDWRSGVYTRTKHHQNRIIAWLAFTRDHQHRQTQSSMAFTHLDSSHRLVKLKSIFHVEARWNSENHALLETLVNPADQHYTRALMGETEETFLQPENTAFTLPRRPSPDPWGS